MTPISWNADAVVEHGRTTARFRQKQVNFYRNGIWRPIVPRFFGRFHDQSDLIIEAPKNSSGRFAIMGQNGPLTIFPLDCCQSQCEEVDGSILYRNAYGPGTTLEYFLHSRRRLQIEKRITLPFASRSGASFDFEVCGQFPKLGLKLLPGKAWDDFGNSVPVSLQVIRIGKRTVLRKTLLPKDSRKLIGQIHLDATLSVQSDGLSGGSSVDGYAYRVSYSGETFSDIRNGSGTHSAMNTSPQAMFLLTSSSDPSEFSELRRSFWTFDTSSMGVSSHVISASLSFFGGASISNPDELDLSICLQPASLQFPNYVYSSDYGNYTGSELDRMAYSSWNISGYNVFDISDVSVINNNGVSQFCTREGTYDYDNSSPSMTTPTASSYVYAQSADDPFGRDPTLEIVYVSGNSRHGMLLGVG